MAAMTPDQFRIKATGRLVTVTPNPIHHPKLTAEIKRRLPQNLGWIHFTYAAGKFSRTIAGNQAAEREAIELLTRT
jgi:hypothetical protein